MLTGPWTLGPSKWSSFERSCPERLHLALKGRGHIQYKEETSHCRGTCCHWPISNLRSCHWPPSKSEGPQLSRSARHRTNSLSTFNVSCWWSNAGCCRKVHSEEHSSGCVTTLDHEPNSCYLDTWMACSWNCCHFHIRIQDMALCAVVWSFDWLIE